MVRRVTIGSKLEIIAEKNENEACKAQIATLSSKNETQLREWFDQYFRQFTKEEQDGLWEIVKTLWVVSKFLKKIWRIFMWINTLK